MSTSSLTTRKNYCSLDIAKFFCAILIISSHFASELGDFPTIIDYGFSLYVIAVPFFFCCSGFLFFKKLFNLPTKEEKKKYFVQYEKRIWTMYGLWTAVYFIHVVYDWIVDKELGVVVFLKYLYRCIVFSSYSTIWFLPALGVGVAITYFLVMKLKKKQIMVIAVLLYIFSMFGYTYRFVFAGTPIETFYEIYCEFFVSSRNGVFNGVPFIFMGSLIAQKNIIPSMKGFFKYAIPAGVSLGLVVVEAFVLKLKFNVTGMDVGVFIVAFTYFFIMTVLHLDIKENKLWIWFRKLSLLIFVSQRIFLSALPDMFPAVFEKIYANSYIGLVAVIGMTITFSVVLILLSKKVKIIRKMI